MPEKITWTLNVQVVGGPRLSASQTIEVEAYDMIEVKVPGMQNATPRTAMVEVQPGGSNQVKFLMITSSIYDANLTYKVDGGSEIIKLDALQLLMGVGALGLLGATANIFTFTNEVGKDNTAPIQDASIQILVGRKATPETTT
jgi:hypothetical protein